MSSITFAATSKAASAPDLEPGMYDARFDGVEAKVLTGGKFQKNEAGDPKFEWAFTLFDGGDPIVNENEESDDYGQDIQLTSLTSQSVNVASQTVPGAVKCLKALMTPPEFAEFESGGGIDASALLGRMVQVQVIVKENGWPTIVGVLPAKKSRKASVRTAAPADLDED